MNWLKCMKCDGITFTVGEDETNGVITLVPVCTICHTPQMASRENKRDKTTSDEIIASMKKLDDTILDPIGD